MGAAGSTEMVKANYQTTRCHNTENTI